jgi:ubiquinone/menaquinone biosynthesis C-methylase UbiE
MRISERLSDLFSVHKQIRFVQRVLRHLMYRLTELDGRVGGRQARPYGQQQDAVVSTTRHDMVAYPDEPYYQRQYWYWIEKALDELANTQHPICLDLGCGQGRLTIPLTRKFPTASVIGFDFSEQAIAAARDYASALAVTNVEYRVADIHETVRTWPGNSAAVILMTEVTFFYPRWQEDLAELERILVEGGIMAVAFRPQYYDMLNIVRYRMWEKTDLLINQRLGPLYGNAMDFTWQKSGEIRRLFASRPQMEMLNLVGIGCCSGLEYDPHASITRPSELDDDEQQRLMQLELSVAAEIPDAGRYMLAIARKRACPPVGDKGAS